MILRKSIFSYFLHNQNKGFDIWTDPVQSTAVNW